MGTAEVEMFLTQLVVERHVATPTQNQAFFVLLFIYREVLSVDLPWLDKFTPAKHSNHVPVVLTKEEVRIIVGELSGINWLLANLALRRGLVSARNSAFAGQRPGFRFSANRRS